MTSRLYDVKPSCWSLTTYLELSRYRQGNISVSNQGIPRILWKNEVHYRGKTPTSPCPKPHPSNSRPRFHFLRSHFNIISLFTSRSSKWSFFPRVSPRNPCMHFSSPLYDPDKQIDVEQCQKVVTQDKRTAPQKWCFSINNVAHYLKKQDENLSRV